MNRKIFFILCMIGLISNNVFPQKPFRIGTTSANFLEIGFGNIASGMGDAHVAVVDGDLTSTYWNPASLAYRTKNEVFVNIQPWFSDINTTSAGIGYSDPSMGNFSFNVITMDYGSEEVTTVSNPEGTGEIYDGADFAFCLSYGRKIVDWFAFGFTGKYITSQIWHETASALAFDIGATVNTKFFKWSDMPGDGLNIGVSISNYGTRLLFDGLDLKQSVDIKPDENGNYANVPVKYELDEWELPLIFRLGVSFFAYKSEFHNIEFAIDALHPNNNSESLNIGCQYNLNIPTYGQIFLRGGYKGLFMDESQYGLSFGVGVLIKSFGNQAAKFDFAYRSHSSFGNINAFSIGYIF